MPSLLLFVTMPVVIVNRFIICAFALCKIGGSHCSGAEDSGVLGCDTVLLEGYVVPPSSKVEPSKKISLFGYCP
jgi:hypothetical protein